MIKREKIVDEINILYNEIYRLQCLLDNALAVDIVRCKECKHRNKFQWVTNLDGTETRYKCDCIGEYMLERNFCSFGEREDNE